MATKIEVSGKRANPRLRGTVWVLMDLGRGIEVMQQTGGHGQPEDLIGDGDAEMWMSVKTVSSGQSISLGCSGYRYF